MQPYILDDKEYGKVLDNVVVACVDVAVLHKGKILLEKRVEESAKDELWIFGGRVLVGEELEHTASRGVARELGLEIADSRFTRTGTYNLRWPRRREPRAENGCHHLLVAHAVELDDSEKALLDTTLANDKLRQWYELAAIEQATVSPQLWDVLSDIKILENIYV